MHWRKIALLALVVAGLAWLALRGEEEQRALTESRQQIPLLPGLERARIHAVRVERAVEADVFRFERDEGGRWWLVDPLAWRAEPAQVQALLDLGTSSSGVLDSLVGAEGAGLQPPIYEVVYFERLSDGTERRHRIEVGGRDFEQQTLFVRAGALGEERILRTGRAALGLLERPLDEFRDRRLMDAHHGEVQRLVRRGVLVLPPRDEDGPDEVDGVLDGERDPAAPSELGIAFEAVQERGEWFSSSPVRARLDPGAMGLLLRALTQMRAISFLEDREVPLEPFGLQPPMFELEAELARGETVALRFGVSPGELFEPLRRRVWTLNRAGEPEVLGADARDVLLLTRPLAYLVDHRLVRFAREELNEVELDLEGEGVRLRRAIGRWFLVERAEDDSERLPPAADEAVADLAALLERSEVRFYPFLRADGSQELPDPQPEVHGRLELTLAGGARAGFEFGPPHTAGERSGRLVRRFGEQLWGLLDEDVVRRLPTQRITYLPRELVRLVEHQQTELIASAGERRRRWLRDEERGQWRASGEVQQDMPFSLLVDALLRPRVRRWLEPEEAALPFQRPVRVEILARGGGRAVYELGIIELESGPIPVARLLGDEAAVAEVGRLPHERLSEFLGD